ncbi:MAG: metallophosphoesterase family protein [Myxococcales bacterium]|nr:metallophosphoesterase family protein [Myxococcales bacterium]
MRPRSPRAASRALAVSLCLAALSAGAASLTRQPYLQSVSRTSGLVAFRTDTSCPAQVRFGAGDLAQMANASSVPGTRHLVTLTGLAPATEYSYVVEACGAALTQARSFRTAPAPGTRSVHFTAMGDMGMGNADQIAVANGTLRVRPELVLTVGDNAYSSGTESEWHSRFFAPMAGLLSQVPIFPSAGNHDYQTAQAQPYIDNLYLPSNNRHRSERYYSFDWGHVHFAAIDSSCAIGAGPQAVCGLAEQKTWLQQDLAQSQAFWKVVYFHHAPYTSGSHGSQLAIRRELGPLFEAHGVDLVLAGHDHDYERSYPLRAGSVVPAGSGGAVVYLVVGNGGASLRPFSSSQPSWSAFRNDTAKGFLDVSVNEGVLLGRMLRPDGSAVDSFSITKPLPPLAPPLALTVAVEGERGPLPVGDPSPTDPGGTPPQEQLLPPAEEAPVDALAPGVGCASSNPAGLAFALAGLLVSGLLLRRRGRITCPASSRRASTPPGSGRRSGAPRAP